MQDCKNCENEIMLKLADYEIEKDNLVRHVEILKRALDVKEDLLNFYREKSEQLENKLKILQK